MKRFKNILYVVNPDDEAACALERAVTLAENNQAALTVVTVVEALPASGALRGSACAWPRPSWRFVIGHPARSFGSSMRCSDSMRKGGWTAPRSYARTRRWRSWSWSRDTSIGERETAVVDAGSRFVAQGGRWQPSPSLEQRILRAALGELKCERL